MAEINELSLIGKGIAFPLKVNLQANINLSAKFVNLEESIRIILGTRLGERVYRPDFGCRLDELIFAPMNTETLLLIKIYVREAITKWEPRVILKNVYVEVASSPITLQPSPELGKLKIIIEYTPKNHHETLSMVYPFYLQSPGG
jgi:uncharacterized protein